MPTQVHLPVQPARAEPINAVLAIVREGDEVAYFACGVPVFVHDDPQIRRTLVSIRIMALALLASVNPPIRISRSDCSSVMVVNR